MKIIFLDIDGVLNASCEDEPSILPPCAERLNRIIQATGAKVVISSGWRHLVHDGLMTEMGFERMLRTHKVCCHVVGVTPAEAQVSGRGNQIAAWLEKNGPLESYVVIDDDLGILEPNHPLVKTNGGIGLSEEDAALAIKLLRNGVEVSIA